MCYVPSHREVQFLALAVALLPAQVDLVSALGLHTDLGAPHLTLLLDSLTGLHGLEYNLLWVDSCNQIINIEYCLEVSLEAEAIPVLILDHDLE